MKNAVNAALKGYDSGMKVSETQRCIAADTNSLPHAQAAATAEETDRERVSAGVAEIQIWTKWVQSLLTDRGYMDQPFTQGASRNMAVPIAARSELKGLIQSNSTHESNARAIALDVTSAWLIEPVAPLRGT